MQATEAGGAWVSGGGYTPSTGDILITHDSNGDRHTACVVSCDGDKIKTIAGGGSGIHHGSISVGSGRLTGFVVPEWWQTGGSRIVQKTPQLSAQKEKLLYVYT